MKIQIYSYDDAAEREPLGSAWLDAETKDVRFSDLATKELCESVAMDSAGPVPVQEAERFLRSLPECLSGSNLRAEVEP
jgi:hypothetical protein